MYTLGIEEINLKITLGVVAMMAACSSACFAVYCAKKVDETRDKIKGLRKQYKKVRAGHLINPATYLLSVKYATS